MLERLKLLANKRDVPYQSLLKMFVAERLKAEFESKQPDTRAVKFSLSEARAADHSERAHLGVS